MIIRLLAHPVFRARFPMRCVKFSEELRRIVRSRYCFTEISGYTIDGSQIVANIWPIYSSINSGTTSWTETNNMYSDYINASREAEIINRHSNYIIQRVYVSRLGSDYLYLAGTMDNGDGIMLRALL